MHQQLLAVISVFSLHSSTGAYTVIAPNENRRNQIQKSMYIYSINFRMLLIFLIEWDWFTQVCSIFIFSFIQTQTHQILSSFFLTLAASIISFKMILLLVLLNLFLYVNSGTHSAIVNLTFLLGFNFFTSIANKSIQFPGNWADYGL